ncbi:hypothetical protein XENOCAPTIV_019422, partial [Xenoophorus captivus]
LRFDYGPDSPLQYPGVGLTREAEECDPPIVGTHPDLKYSGLISSTPKALPPWSFLTTSVNLGSRHLHEDHTIEARDVVQYGAATMEKSWGADSPESAWSGCCSWDTAWPSPNKRCKAIPKWAHPLQAEAL